MKKVLLGLLFLTLSFSAFSSEETFILDYTSSHTKDLDLKEGVKLDNLLEDLEMVEGKIHLILLVSKAAVVDSNGKQLSPSRQNEITFLRGLRLRDYIIHSFGKGRSGFTIKLDFSEDSSSNQVTIEVHTEE